MERIGQIKTAGGEWVNALDVEPGERVRILGDDWTKSYESNCSSHGIQKGTVYRVRNIIDDYGLPSDISVILEKVVHMNICGWDVELLDRDEDVSKEDVKKELEKLKAEFND